MIFFEVIGRNKEVAERGGTQRLGNKPKRAKKKTRGCGHGVQGKDKITQRPSERRRTDSRKTKDVLESGGGGYL